MWTIVPRRRNGHLSATWKAAWEFSKKIGVELLHRIQQFHYLSNSKEEIKSVYHGSSELFDSLQKIYTVKIEN